MKKKSAKGKRKQNEYIDEKLKLVLQIKPTNTIILY